jgi:hypothetical protein
LGKLKGRVGLVIPWDMRGDYVTGAPDLCDRNLDLCDRLVTGMAWAKHKTGKRKEERGKQEPSIHN